MNESITLTDNRNGASVEVPIVNGTVDARAWADLLPGVYFHDPSFGNTSGAASAVCELDGDAGYLRYRGHPIEQLAEQATFLEVAHLLLFGELPTRPQLNGFADEIAESASIHENFHKRILEGFRDDAHAMGVLVSSVAALSTFYPDGKDVEDPTVRRSQMIRLLAKIPTLAASAYRRSVGTPYVQPDPDLPYTSNFLSMMFRPAEGGYEVDPVLTRALDLLFVLHADHGQNCSTTTARAVGSSHADPYVLLSAACSALSGPRHGGANEAVLRMLEEIGSYDQVDDFVAKVKTGEQLLMGFGHRVYKNYDPRATVMRQCCDEVLAELGLENDPLLKIAKRLEQIALEDPYFVEKKLYPNVDFYSGIILKALGIPVEMFTVIFATGRTIGWISHWNEMISGSYKIGRPRQLYTGAAQRDFVALDKR